MRNTEEFSMGEIASSLDKVKFEIARYYFELKELKEQEEELSLKLIASLDKDNPDLLEKYKTEKISQKFEFHTI